MDVSVEGEEMEVLRSVPTLETSSSEQDRGKAMKQCSMGKRLLIIELRKYNSAEELHIGTGTTGSQGHLCYQNGDRRASVTRAAVRMGVEGMGMRTRHKGASKWGPSQERAQRRGRRLRSNQRSINIQ